MYDLWLLYSVNGLFVKSILEDFSIILSIHLPACLLRKEGAKALKKGFPAKEKEAFKAYKIQEKCSGLTALCKSHFCIKMHKWQGGLSFVAVPCGKERRPPACWQEAGFTRGPASGTRALTIPCAGQSAGALHLWGKGMKVGPGFVAHGAEPADAHLVGHLVERGSVGQLLLVGAALE
ncbi:MAG: hypothetical protein U0N08_02575, partial [Oscillospiraceae bacterium]